MTDVDLERDWPPAADAERFATVLTTELAVVFLPFTEGVDVEGVSIPGVGLDTEATASLATLLFDLDVVVGAAAFVFGFVGAFALRID